MSIKSLNYTPQQHWVKLFIYVEIFFVCLFLIIIFEEMKGWLIFFQKSRFYSRGLSLYQISESARMQFFDSTLTGRAGVTEAVTANSCLIARHLKG